MEATPRLLGGRYEVGELIGRGGMAEVHAGYDTRLGRSVAIKMLRSDLARDPAFLARFRREAQSAAGLNHPSIVAVYDSGEDQVLESGGARIPLPYIVMEYVEGRTLRDILQEHRAMDAADAARVTEGVLAALAYSHRMGIVHRDIKPANVMITLQGDVKVMDFGIARAIADTAATMTQTQAVVGTAQYLSPEQAQGHTVDARSDLYSTGCLLYELLTARTPFVGDSPVAIAYQHVGESPQPPSVHNPGVPAAFDAVVLHALSKDREARYQTATEFRADLQAARTGRPISSGARGTAAGAAAVGAAALASAGDPTVALNQGAAATQAIATATADRTPGDHHGNTATLPAIGHDPNDEPRRRHAAWYVLLTLAVIGALVLVTLAGKALFTGSQAAPKVAVPTVVRLTQTVAVARIRAAGLNPQVSPVTNSAEKGLVVDQNPQPGEQVPQNTTVTISVSAGPGQVPVPDLSGFTEAAARQTLDDLGLVVGKVEQVDNSTVRQGQVISTDPPANKQVDAGSTVNLKISSGKVKVPDMRGKDRSEAQSTLSDLGLRTRTTFKPSDQPQGTVLDQDHVGDVVAAGTTITLVVAETPAPTPTPTPTPSTPSTTVTVPVPTTLP